MIPPALIFCGGTHLVFGQQGQVQQNFNGFRVSRHHNNLADAAVEGLGGCSTGGWFPVNWQIYFHGWVL